MRGGYRTNLIDGFNIINGSLTGYENGAGILCSDASPVIRYNNIYANATSNAGQGGGIYSWYGAPEIVGNFIGYTSSSYNSSGEGGGIMTRSSIANIAQNWVRYNKSSDCGGGIYVVGNIVYEGIRIENNYINSNSASYRGSGAYVMGTGYQQDALVVAYNTITNNTGGSGALFLNSPHQTAVVNNIVYSNSGGIMKQGDPITVVRNCVYSNGTDWSSGITHNTDINSTPDLGTLYHLNSTSPCKNAADPSYVELFDIEGRSRPVGGAYDIGCYEY